MTTWNEFDGMPYAGNPHVAPSRCHGVASRFDEEGGASVAMPRRGSPLHTIKCLFLALAALAASLATAEEVFLLPPSSILWRTAPTANFEVPVLMPKGASSATLVISGNGYRREYTDLAEGMVPVSLPAANSVDAENVYEFTLAFNDAAGTTRKAQIAVVQGMFMGGTGETHVRTVSSSKWSNVRARAVLSIPAGADTLSVNGVPVVPEPDGAPGWALLLTRPRTAYDLLLTGGGRSLAEALLYGITSGFMLVFW